MKKINRQDYDQEPDRYELRPGSSEGAPPCPYGNQYQWVGYDRQSQEYVRFTKSVFKELVQQAQAASTDQDISLEPS